MLGAAKAPSPGTPRRTHRSRSPASASPSPSSACATGATLTSPGTEQRPKVFLACLGRASDFTARASFAKEPVRGRRHRGGGRKRRQSDETIQRFRRQARLPLLVGQGLCRRGRQCSRGAGRGRRNSRLSGRQAREIIRRPGKTPGLAHSFIKAVIRLGYCRMLMRDWAHDPHPRLR